ncbi:MAG TPA: sigma-70 family RNA polymerase sigma factor [Chryseolinea sp.]|nr:sigma-70 family RNA polymerase sigma factor [Chryseolinea sp.]
MLFDPEPPLNPQSGKWSGDKNAELDDEHLWENVTKDNALAFSVLYKKYVQKLYNFGIHLCHDHDLVLDCMQELFATLWTRRQQLDVIHSVNAYLIMSFRRLLIKRVTWRRRFMMKLSPAAEFDVVPPIESTIVSVEQAELVLLKLGSAIKSLTRRQREAIFLKFYNDLTYAEIALVMDLHVDSIYNIISKALSNLRRSMGK